jgi:predicted N-formylglutamate amidohydrolase
MSQDRLLDPSEPAALAVHAPEARSPFLLTCDHAGQRIPRRLEGLGIAADELQTHIAWDLGALGFAEKLATELGASLFSQRYSRLVIDCNRPLDAHDSIPERSGGVEIVGNHGLSPARRKARIDEIFLPYHSAIENELSERGSRGQKTVLVTLHSFTPSLFGKDRPWHTGILYRDDTRLAAPLLAELRREPELVVGDNEPYSVSETSDYAVNVYGEARNIPYVELEIRQDLLADEAGQHEWARRYARLLRLVAAPYI